MAIVAKKRGGAGTRGGVRESGQKGGALESGWETRWKRVVPLAVLLALAAVVAWKFAASRPENPPHLSDETPMSEPVAARTESAHANIERHDAAPLAVPETTLPAPGRAVAHPETESASGNIARQNAAPPVAGERSVAQAADLPEQPAADADGKVFDNPVENRLEAVSRYGFESIVTLRVDLPQEEIVEILKRPVEIYDDDDEETIAAKERTAEMKAAALDYIEAGGTLNQFLRDCQAEANEARETVRDVREEMKRILEAEGVDAAQAYLDRQNPLLREQGLEEVHIGMGLIRAIERRKARQTEQGN